MRQLTSEQKILSFYEDAKKLVKGELVIPRMVSVWLSHCCNLGCRYCLYSEINAAKTLIDTKKFYRLIDELSSLGIEGLEFSGGGEPTVHKECFKFAKYARSKGLRVGMFTNGRIVDTSKVKYFDFVRIGLDATNPKDYAKVKNTKKGVFNDVLDNVQRYLENKTKEKLPRVGLKLVVTEDNWSRMGDFVRLGMKQGVDYVHFRKIVKSRGYKEKKVEVEMGRLYRWLKGKSSNFVYGSFEFELLKKACFMAPIHAVITADGSLLNCCYFNKKKYIIGNVLDSGFKKICFSDRHKEVLSSIKINDCNIHTCRWRRYNNLYRDIIKGYGESAFI